MNGFSPELARFPFADKSWHPSLTDDAPPPITPQSPRLAPREKPDPGKDDVVRKRGNGNTGRTAVAPSPYQALRARVGRQNGLVMAPYASGKPVGPRSSLQEKLIAEGAVQSVINFAPALEEFHHGSDLDRLSSVFDIDLVRAFLDRPPEQFADKRDVNRAFQLFCADIWMRESDIDRSQSLPEKKLSDIRLL